MQLRDKLGRLAAIVTVIGAVAGDAYANSTVQGGLATFEAGADAVVVHFASVQLQQTGTIRSTGVTENFSSLDRVCADLVRNVSRERSSSEGRSTRELRQLMKGMRCVE